MREACLRYLEEVYCHQIVLMPTESDFEAKNPRQSAVYTTPTSSEVLDMLTERSRQVRSMIPGPQLEETKEFKGAGNAIPAKTPQRSGLTKSFAVAKRGSGEPMKPSLKERLFKLSLRQNNSQ